MFAKRWSGLVFGYGLILLVTVMLGAFTMPMSALADGSSGTNPPVPPLCPDTTNGGSSVSDPTIVDPSTGDLATMDLLLLTIDSIMML